MIPFVTPGIPGLSVTIAVAVSLMGQQLPVDTGRDVPAHETGFRGRVTMTGTGTAVEGVHLEFGRMVGERDRLEGTRSSTVSAVSDPSGAFEVVGLPPGEYRVNVEGDGLFLPGSDWRGVNVTPGPVTLRDGEMVTLDYEMTPPAIVSGQVLHDGEPVPGVIVSVLQYAYEEGQRVLTECLCGGLSASDASPIDEARLAATTDENGAYRLGAVPPGDHYLVAQVPDSRLLALGLKAVGKTGQWSPAYYPGTVDWEAAARVHVTAGSVMTGVDIDWEDVPLVAIRGQVIGPGVGELVPHK